MFERLILFARTKVAFDGELVAVSNNWQRVNIRDDAATHAHDIVFLHRRANYDLLRFVNNQSDILNGHIRRSINQRDVSAANNSIIFL